MLPPRAGVLSLLLALLPGCSLTADAWRRATMGARSRGGCSLEVLRVEAATDPARLLVFYRAVDDGPQYGHHLPIEGWLDLRPLPGRSKEDDAALRGLLAGRLAPTAARVVKHQRGVRIRWHARLDYPRADREPGHAYFHVAASPTKPAGASRCIDQRCFPAVVAFEYYKRRSRAHLVTEALLLTPPLLIADLGCNIGGGIANIDWGDALGQIVAGAFERLLGDDDDDKRRSHPREHEHSPQRNPSRTRRTSPAPRPQGGRRVSRVR